MSDRKDRTVNSDFRDFCMTQVVLLGILLELFFACVNGIAEELRTWIAGDRLESSLQVFPPHSFSKDSSFVVDRRMRTVTVFCPFPFRFFGLSLSFVHTERYMLPL